MGLMVYSLDNVPVNARRDYFIYLLDFGWSKPIKTILGEHFDKMVRIAAQNKAVVITGVAEHFEDEVFSYHSINGENAEDILPALLITNMSPHYFKDKHGRYFYKLRKEISLYEKGDFKMVLIPFKPTCSNDAEIISLVESVFQDIENGNDLTNFKVLKKTKKGFLKKIWDSVVLRPTVGGVGFDAKKFFEK